MSTANKQPKKARVKARATALAGDAIDVDVAEHESELNEVGKRRSVITKVGGTRAPAVSAAADADESFAEPAGLSTTEVEALLQQWGPNEVEEERVSLWKLFFAKFWGPVPALLEIAVLLSAVNAIISRENSAWIDFGVLLVLLLINGLVGFHEERNANAAVEALRGTLAPMATAKRDGAWGAHPARDLVPGDLISIKLGAIVPADAELVHGKDVHLDQSSLTGESLAVDVNTGELARAGAIVRRGEAIATVTKTGARTYMGEAMSLVGSATTHAVRSRFQRVILRLTRVLIALAIFGAIVIFFSQVFYQHETVVHVVGLCLVLLVASMPVAIEVVSTAVMAIGSRELSARGVIVTHLSAITELAGLEVLCSDKTGTLTLNELTVGELKMTEHSSEIELITVAALTLNRNEPDPIDKAILKKLREANDGVHESVLDGYSRLAFRPFNPDTKRSEATVVAKADGTRFVACKGSITNVFKLCKMPAEEYKAALLAVEELAERGLRCLGVARAPLAAHDMEAKAGDYTFLGMLSLSDPLRHDSAATVAALEAVDIDVKMITGDHVVIGKETGRQLGMTGAFYGAEFVRAIDEGLHTLDGVSLEQIVLSADGFANVAPKHKHFIVDTIQKHGHMVAMTGDGVNDAPALKKANVGIAVSGASDAARAAADLVLMTPGVGVIGEALKISKMVFARVENYVTYRVSATLEFLLFMACAILFIGFSVPAIALVLITLLNDFVSMSIAYDLVKAPAHPMRWRLRYLSGLAITVGLVATCGVIGGYYSYLVVSRDAAMRPLPLSAADVAASTNMYGLKVSQMCFYSPQTDVFVQRYNRTMNLDGFCHPDCPGYDEDTRSCGDWGGPSSVISVVFMILCIGGQVKIFIMRTSSFFFTAQPGKLLMASSVFCWLATTLIAAFVSPALELSTFANIKHPVTNENMHFQVYWSASEPIMLLYSLLFCIVLFLCEDLSKLLYNLFSLQDEASENVDRSAVESKRTILGQIRNFLSGAHFSARPASGGSATVREASDVRANRARMHKIGARPAHDFKPHTIVHMDREIDTIEAIGDQIEMRPMRQSVDFGAREMRDSVDFSSVDFANNKKTERKDTSKKQTKKKKRNS